MPQILEVRYSTTFLNEQLCNFHLAVDKIGKIFYLYHEGGADLN